MPLLLHSLGEFRELITGALELVDAHTIVEVGAETGLNTHVLADWAREHDATLHCVEPEPSDSLAEAATSPQVHLVAGYSPDVLPDIGPADVYVLDGDHNYVTARGELDAIEKLNDRFPLVLMNDVCWPSGRRDQYYDPDRLPEEGVHPHTWERAGGVDEGVTLDDPGTIRGGFRGQGQFAVARAEGGPRNGVLTAVEDFLADRPDLAWMRVPAVFGLGVLYPASAPWADAIADLFRPYDENPLLARLERNRLVLYLRVLKLQDEMTELHARHDRTIAGYEAGLAHLTSENAALRLRLAEQESASLSETRP